MKKTRFAALALLAALGFILAGGLNLFVPLLLKRFSPYPLAYASVEWKGPNGSSFTKLETNAGPAHLETERANLKLGFGLIPPSWILEGRLGPTVLKPETALGPLKEKLRLKKGNFFVSRGIGKTMIRFGGIAEEFQGRSNVPVEIFFRDGLLELRLDGKVMFRLEYTR